MFLTLSSVSYAYEIGRSVESGYINIKLPPPVKEALDNGISLTFQCDFQISTKKWFISWPKREEQHTFTLTFHSLSNRYLVNVNDKERPMNFYSIGEATDYITNHARVLFKEYGSNKTNAKMRLSLNKFKLPGPIRLNAFIATQWNIDTGWIAWSPEI